MKISIDQITLDPNQPRKFIDDNSINELSQSIAVNGLLQPIGVREIKPNQYKLVYGERRLRAHQVLERTDIEATVYSELSDQDTLAIQLIENAQREDIRPVDEANAINRLQTQYGYNDEAIAHNLGKTIYYIRQRKILNNLIPEFAKLVNDSIINISDALKIAASTKEYQSEVWEDQNGNSSNWVRYFSGKELKVFPETFETKTSPIQLPCTQCIYNSGFAGLFPVEGTHICSNVVCFDVKAQAYIIDVIANAILEPNTILFKRQYEDIPSYLVSVIGDTKIYDQNNLDIILLPNSIDPDDYMEDGELDVDTYNADLITYKEDLEEYEKAIQSPEVLIGYKVSSWGNSDKLGTKFYVKLGKESSKQNKGNIKDVMANTKKGGAVTQDNKKALQEEIERLKTKEERSKELDSEKVSTQIDKEVFPKLDIRHLDQDTYLVKTAHIYALLNAIGYEYTKEKDTICKTHNINEKSFRVLDTDKNCIKDVDTAIFELTCLLIKHALKGVHARGYMYNNHDLFKFRLCHAQHPHDVDIIVETQKEIADRRIEKVNARIKELKPLVAKAK